MFLTVLRYFRNTSNSNKMHLGHSECQNYLPDTDLNMCIFCFPANFKTQLLLYISGLHLLEKQVIPDRETATCA